MQSNIAGGVGLLFTPDMALQQSYIIVDEDIERDVRLYRFQTTTGPLYIVTHRHFIVVMTSSAYISEIAFREVV